MSLFILLILFITKWSCRCDILLLFLTSKVTLTFKENHNLYTVYLFYFIHICYNVCYIYFNKYFQVFCVIFIYFLNLYLNRFSKCNCWNKIQLVGNEFLTLIQPDLHSTTVKQIETNTIKQWQDTQRSISLSTKTMDLKKHNLSRKVSVWQRHYGWGDKIQSENQEYIKEEVTRQWEWICSLYWLSISSAIVKINWCQTHMQTVTASIARLHGWWRISVMSGFHQRAQPQRPPACWEKFPPEPHREPLQSSLLLLITLLS